METKNKKIKIEVEKLLQYRNQLSLVSTVLLNHNYKNWANELAQSVDEINKILEAN